MVKVKKGLKKSAIRGWGIAKAAAVPQMLG